MHVYFRLLWIVSVTKSFAGRWYLYSYAGLHFMMFLSLVSEKWIQFLWKPIILNGSEKKSHCQWGYLVIEPFKNNDFHMSCGHFSETGKRIFGHLLCALAGTNVHTVNNSTCSKCTLVYSWQIMLTQYEPTWVCGSHSRFCMHDYLNLVLKLFYLPCA